MPAGSITTVALGLEMQVGMPAPAEMPNYPPLGNAFSQGGFEGQYEQRYPFDSQQNWVHGYFQEIPAYGGHVFYRPYNYKDVLSQSQTAGGWGLSPTMPYSQQFWHRYHDQATMLKLSRTSPAPSLASPPAAPILPAGNWAQPNGYWMMPAAPVQPVAQPMMPPVYYPAAAWPYSAPTP
uniref:Uncharacterized protein n=1 Tax=Schlesneria paludicola TaxID=360056 RepID=A0A7C2JYH7_9PLAN